MKSKKKKKSFILWADDDWTVGGQDNYKNLMVFGNGESLGCFHYLLKNCFEGKPRKVRITIEEV